MSAVKLRPAESVAFESPDGKVRNLLYTMAAFRQFDKATGTTWLKFLTRIEKGASGDEDSVLDCTAEEYAALVWCGLLHETPDLKLDDVAAWLTIESMNLLMPVIFQALYAHLPKPEKKRELSAVESGTG